MPEQLSLDFDAVKPPRIGSLDLIPAAHLKRIAFCPNTGCWLWYGAQNQQGYGSLRVAQKTIDAHLHIRRLLVGPTVEGCELHHTCEMKCCVNPEHLEEVTRSEHRKRHPDLLAKAHRAAGDKQLAKTHCPHGHPYSGYNLIVRKDRPGYRDCRECGRIAQREYYIRRRARLRANS